MHGPHDDSQGVGSEVRHSSLSEFAPTASDTIAAIAAAGRIDRHDEVLHGESSREGMNTPAERRGDTALTMSVMGL